MPDMDGAALALEIRRRWPELAGPHPAHHRRRARCRPGGRLGARGLPIFEKPLDLAALSAELHRRIAAGDGAMTAARASWWWTTSPTSGRCSPTISGCRAIAVGTAADAVELDARLAEAPADVIVLDINMPGENGLAALARLRAAGSRAGVILLTAAGTLGDRLAGLTDGADDYVVKPFEPRELLARIRAVLRRLDADGRRRRRSRRRRGRRSAWGAAPSTPRRAACATPTAPRSR